jgi:hypothetical protein
MKQYFNNLLVPHMLSRQSPFLFTKILKEKKIRHFSLYCPYVVAAKRNLNILSQGQGIWNKMKSY